jgi:hypothetical protein
MKRTVLIGAFFAIALPAFAQTTTTTTTTTTFTPEQATAVQTYITEQNTVSVDPPEGFTVGVGAAVPDTVEVYEFPAEVGVTGSYTVIGGQKVVLGPDRKIIHVID